MKVTTEYICNKITKIPRELILSTKRIEKVVNFEKPKKPSSMENTVF